MLFLSLFVAAAFLGFIAAFAAAAVFATAFGSPTVEKPLLPFLIFPNVSNNLTIDNHTFDFAKNQLVHVLKFLCSLKTASETPRKFHEKTPVKAQGDLRGLTLLGPRVSIVAFAVFVVVCTLCAAFVTRVVFTAVCFCCRCGFEVDDR